MFHNELPGLGAWGHDWQRNMSNEYPVTIMRIIF